MTNVQHLIENAIYAVKDGRTVEEEMEDRCNQMMLQETGITSEEIVEIVDHVVFGLYDGKFPN